MERFESNSIKRREDITNKDSVEKKKIEKVTKHQITVKKKSLGQRAGEALLSDETPSIGSYILGDVLIPAIKDTLADMATSAINMAFYGDTRGLSRSRHNNTRIYRGEVRSYDRCYDRPGRSERSMARLNNKYDVDNVIFGTRSDAESVLDVLLENIDRYRQVTVGDYYDAIGEQTRASDFNYGWYELGTARIKPTGNGYVLELPRPQALD